MLVFAAIDVADGATRMFVNRVRMREFFCRLLVMGVNVMPINFHEICSCDFRHRIDRQLAHILLAAIAALLLVGIGLLVALANDVLGRALADPGEIG